MEIKKKIVGLIEFLNVGVWRTQNYTGFKGWFYRIIRIVLIVVKEIEKDKITLKSSAITYLSILSIVPLVAIVFGISKGFGLEGLIETELDRLFLGQEVVKDAIFGFAQKMLENTQGGVIVGVSIVVLLFTVMRLMNNIEDVFNSIWGKQRSRNLIRKLTDYLALLVFAPIIIVMSSGVTFYIENKIRTLGQNNEMEVLLTPLATVLVFLSPFVLIWLLFTMIYVIMPNVSVKFQNGLIAGVIAGSLFQLLQWGFINFSFIMGNYGAVYGGLAVLPLFFVFTQLSWTTVFVGGELSYALQVEGEYIPEEKDVKFSYDEQRRISLLTMKAIVKRFKIGEEPYTKMSLSRSLDIPHRFVSNSINRLVSAGVLTKSLPEEVGYHVYIPSIDINVIDVSYIINKLDNSGEACLYNGDENEEFVSVNKTIGDLREELENSQSNKLLKDL
ncbi:MAG: YihY/virulence factor BrkB family protein [Reichenbachiella sp.]